jgi:hypothetical protein
LQGNSDGNNEDDAENGNQDEEPIIPIDVYFL